MEACSSGWVIRKIFAMNHLVKPATLSRRTFIGTTSMAVTALLVGRGFAAGSTERRKVDVCIYGGTSGGVIAAVALARLGRSVLLGWPAGHIGGLALGG